MCVPFGKVAMGELSDFPSLRKTLNCGPSETTLGEEAVTDTCSVTLSVVSCDGSLRLGCFRSLFSGVNIAVPSKGDASSNPWRTVFDVSDIPCEGKSDEARMSFS